MQLSFTCRELTNESGFHRPTAGGSFRNVLRKSNPLVPIPPPLYKTKGPKFTLSNRSLYLFNFNTSTRCASCDSLALAKGKERLLSVVECILVTKSVRLENLMHYFPYLVQIHRAHGPVAWRNSAHEVIYSAYCTVL